MTYAEERHAVIFRDFNVAGCAETETYRQTNDDSETDSDDIEIVGAVLKRGEAAKSDDYSHIVRPYRFEPYIAMPNGVEYLIHQILSSESTLRLRIVNLLLCLSRNTLRSSTL